MPNAPRRAPKGLKPTPPPAPPAKYVTTLPPLDAECASCEGKGGGVYGRCQKCRGIGRVPTEAGEAALAFLERYAGRLRDVF